MAVLRRPVPRDRAWHLMDVFAAMLIVTVFAAFVAFDAALLLGAVWLLLWAAQHVVGLFA
jgi:hypothetical protein